MDGLRAVERLGGRGEKKEESGTGVPTVCGGRLGQDGRGVSGCAYAVAEGDRDGGVLPVGGRGVSETGAGGWESGGCGDAAGGGDTRAGRGAADRDGDAGCRNVRAETAAAEGRCAAIGDESVEGMERADAEGSGECLGVARRLRRVEALGGSECATDE